MCDLYILKMEEQLNKELLLGLGRFVSAKKRIRIQNLQKVNHGSQILIGDLLLRNILADYTGEAETDLQFGTNEYGKPYLVNNSKIHFNLSHTEHYILLGVDTEPIGVDIEMYSPRNYLGIANLYFHKSEYEYLKGIQSKEELEKEFFGLWVMKESFLKALGCGFRYPVNKLLFTKDGESYVVNDQEHLDYQIQVVHHEREAVYSVCSKSKLDIRKKDIRLEKLIHHYFALKYMGIS